MNKRKIGILGLVFVMTFFPRVHAACDYDTQNKLAREAANVNVSYETTDVVLDGNGNIMSNMTADDVDAFNDYWLIESTKVTVYNLTENIYITILSDSEDLGTFHYKDTDNGSVDVLVDVNDIHKVVVQVFSENSDCAGTELAKKETTTPKYNTYADMTMCEGMDDYYCQKYITYNIDLTENEVSERIFAKKKEVSETNKEKEESQKNHLFLILAIVGLGILGIIGVVYVIIRIQRKKSVL